jgi:hypothetical protein
MSYTLKFAGYYLKKKCSDNTKCTNTLSAGCCRFKHWRLEKPSLLFRLYNKFFGYTWIDYKEETVDVIEAEKKNIVYDFKKSEETSEKSIEETDFKFEVPTAIVPPAPAPLKVVTEEVKPISEFPIVDEIVVSEEAPVRKKKRYTKRKPKATTVTQVIEDTNEVLKRKYTKKPRANKTSNDE